jgi:hypothetical protein
VESAADGADGDGGVVEDCDDGVEMEVGAEHGAGVMVYR